MLKGEGKKVYQREYMRKKRAKGQVNLKETRSNAANVRPEVRPKIPGLVMQGNRIVGVDKAPEISKVNLPICDEYNFKKFKVGERVLVRRGRRLVETVIPELDVDGNPI